jgi:hypothetical protein
MARVHYHVVRHENGWTYKVGDVFAETYPTHAAALAAARKAAAEQQMGAEPAEIEYEDENGVWRTEHSEGDRPPETDVD